MVARGRWLSVVARAQTPFEEEDGQEDAVVVAGDAAGDDNAAADAGEEEVAPSPSPSLLDDDEESQMEAFMRQQAALEAGGGDAATTVDAGSPGGALLQEASSVGAAEVSDDEVEAYKSDVITMLSVLEREREMTLNEVKLIIAIEDPRAKQTRENFDIEADCGCTRDEMAVALVEVAEKSDVSNRLALKALHTEIMDWPELDTKASSNPDGAASSPSANAGDYAQTIDSDLAKPALPPQSFGRGSDPADGDAGGTLQKDLVDKLPEWVGYALLYTTSVVPILITIGAIAILWTNSFS